MSRDIERSVRKERAVRRERIATAVLAGMHANPNRDYYPADAATLAATAASALMVELDRREAANREGGDA